MPRSPKVRKLTEFEAIELLARELTARGPGVDLGIGDDAALLKHVSGKLVLSVDTCLEHTHFERAWLTPEQLGARAIHTAVSDLAAMGARPVAVLSALVLPEAVTGKELRALGRGQARAAKSLGAVVVGGNIARGRDLSLTTTVIGSAEKALSRKLAQPGDDLWLVGELGLASAGLRLLQQQRSRARFRGASRCLKAWRCPEALVKQGLSLLGHANSAIDISDGLAADAGHIARASGRALIIEQRALEQCLTPELKVVAERLGLESLSLALHGGEDYALLATGPARRRPRVARRIGRVEPGAAVFLEDHDRRLTQVVGGFDHFAH